MNWSNNLNQTYQAVLELGYTSESLMYEVMQPCENLIDYCYWLNKKHDCNALFRVVKTSEGFCCSFNNHGIKRSLEK